MLQNPITFKNPQQFQPQRFLDNPSLPDPSALAFGFGRRYAITNSSQKRVNSVFARVCPGRQMALDALWLAAINILMNFDLRQAVDENGVNIVPKPNLVPGVIWLVYYTLQ
jgi:cytochrome P450